MQAARAKDFEQTSLASLSSRGISRADTDEYLQRLLAGKQQQRSSNAFYSPFAQPAGQQQASVNDRPYMPRSNSIPAVDHVPAEPVAAARGVRQPTSYLPSSQRQPLSRPQGRPSHSIAASSQINQEQSPAFSAVKQLLGAQKFKELRSTVISQQDTFMQQLWDLHRLSRRQEYLTAVCDEPDRLQGETARLHAKPKPAATAVLQPAEQGAGRAAHGSRPDLSPGSAAQMPSLHHGRTGHVHQEQPDSMACQIQHDQRHGPQHHMRNQPAMHFQPNNCPGASQLRSPADLSADMRPHATGARPHAGGMRADMRNDMPADRAGMPADRSGMQDWHAQSARAHELHSRVQQHMQEQVHTGMPPGEPHADQRHSGAQARMQQQQQQGQRDAAHAYGSSAAPGQGTQDRGQLQQQQQQMQDQPSNANGNGPHSDAWQGQDGNPANGPNMYSTMLNSNALGAYGAFMNMCNPYAALQSDPMSAWYATHYGRMACAAAAGAAAATAAAQQRGSFNDNGATSNATRWWQDPQQVFGPAATAFAEAEEDELRAGQHRSQERVPSGRRQHGSDKATVGSGLSRGRHQDGSHKRSKDGSLRDQGGVQGGSMERREVTGTTDDHDMTDRSPRGHVAKRPRPAQDNAGPPPGASAFRRLGSQGAGGMAAVARADSVGSEKSSVVDASAKREETDGAAPVKPQAAAAHAPAMRTAADILASLSSP